jgi:DNA-binding SARP family transcriptional activator/Tfp pilus assembly protein PilF
MEERVRFEILGPMRLAAGAQEIIIKSERDRILLAMLLLSAGRTVPMARLVDAVWDEKAPRDARNQVQGCVSRIRKQLANAGDSRRIVITDPAGYRASVDPPDLDLAEFRRLRDDARSAADQAQAAGQYRAALGLWRGPALAGFDSELVRQAAVALDEEHVQALEECLDAELAIGRAGELVPELTELVRQHPFREKLHANLMLALYRAGRQADALAAYRHARGLFEEELGAAPGDELEQLHRAILNRDPSLTPKPRQAEPLAAAPSASPVPRELPAPVVGFTGRAAALKALDTGLIDDSSDIVAPVVISAVAGTAGVGKTALAVQWAHRVAGRFPDGQLYINLRGYATGPALRPIEALAGLLRSLGTPPEQIPTDEAQAANLYRTRLADRRVLIVLDNARSVDQVRPLLPGSPGCLVLVTSRDRLSGLVAREGARRITLDVLTPEEAEALLSRLLGPERVAAEPEAAADLSRACAYLPLALRIAAASLLDRPTTTVATYASQLKSGDSLAALQVDGDQETAVRIALDMSYRSIPVEARRLFRLLSLVPGTDFTAAAAASLLDIQGVDAQRLLDQLASTHLVAEHAADRYVFHDLLRRYASELAQAEEGLDGCAGATTRLLDWYLHTAQAAAARLYPQMQRLPADPELIPISPAEFDGSATALSWLEAERAGLVGAIEHAAEHGPRPLAWRLADCLRGYFLGSRHTVDWQIAATAALRAAEHDGDQAGRAAALLSLGDLRVSTGQYTDAIERYTGAADAAEKGGWLNGQAAALGNLGIVYRDRGQLAKAEELYTRALAVYQRTGNLAGQASNLGKLGAIASETGQPRRSTEHHAEAVRLYRLLGAAGGEAIALSNLGLEYHALGMLTDAEACLARAMVLHRESGDRVIEGSSLADLAAVHLDMGRLAEALEEAERGVRAVEGLDDTRFEALSLNVLGRTQLHLGEVRRAIDCFQRAAELAKQIEILFPEIEAMIGLALCHQRLATLSEARRIGQAALERARQVGYRVFEGGSLTVLAEIELSDGHYDKAHAYVTEAVGIHRSTEYRLEEARALVVMGKIHRAAGEQEATQHCWRAARKLFTEIGAPVPADVLPSTEWASRNPAS